MTNGTMDTNAAAEPAPPISTESKPVRFCLQESVPRRTPAPDPEAAKEHWVDERYTDPPYRLTDDEQRETFTELIAVFDDWVARNDPQGTKETRLSMQQFWPNPKVPRNGSWVDEWTTGVAKLSDAQQDELFRVIEEAAADHIGA